MSVILLFLKDRKYVAWLALIVLIVGFGWYWHHVTYTNGVNAQRNVDSIENAKALAAADAETLRQQLRADKAELNYANEHSSLINYVTNHPILSAVELCNNAPVILAGTVSNKTRADSGAADSASTAAMVQQVRAGGSAVYPNRLRLLDALAAMADEESAVIREDQANEDTK